MHRSLFLGCGDDSTSTKAGSENADIIASTFDDLPVCSDKRDGATAYVKDAKIAYICEDGKWVEDAEADDKDNTEAKSSSSKENSSSSDVSSSSSDVSQSSSSNVDTDSESSSSVEESSSSVVESSSSAVSSSSSNEVPDSDNESSSSAEKSSSSVAESSSSEESSSSVASSSSEVEKVISYTTECPVGKTCTYAPTTQLNPKINYGELLDTRDYQLYKTVTIGTQTWMAQNLNYEYNEGTAKSYCFDNDVSNCDKYGRLYQRAAAMDSAAVFSTAGKGCGFHTVCSASSETMVRGVCPEGWHLPSYTEWNALFSAVGGESYAPSKLLKSAELFEDGYSDDEVDLYGFSAISAGYRSSSGDFIVDDGWFAVTLWSSTQEQNGIYFSYTYLEMDCMGATACLVNTSAIEVSSESFSVRCLKD